MTDKEKLEAIRVEIHRLVNVRGYDREMANDLFTFMDSLPNEPVSEELEEATTSYADNHYMDFAERGNEDYWKTYYAFKAGAKWQASRSKQNKVKVEIKKR